MDGRRRNRWAAVGLLTASVLTGCNRHATLPNENTPLTPPGEKSSFPEVSKYFGSKDTAAAYGRPPESPVQPRTKAKPGEPLKPETEVALAATEVEAAFAEGRTAVERDQLLDSARQRYQRALKKQPKNAEAMLGLAKLYAAAGDKERAVEMYRAAMKANPKDHALVHKLAGTQATFGDWTGAVETCRAALAMDPENRSYQKTLAFNLAQLGQWDEAYATLAKVMAEAEARYFLGRMLYDQDKAGEAREQMEFALRADPQYAVASQFIADLDAGKTAGIPGQGGIQTVGYTQPATGQALPTAADGLTPAPVGQ